MSEAEGREQTERRLVVMGLQDDAFGQKPLADPKAAVGEELGTRLPEGVRVEAVEETIYRVRPSTSPLGEGGGLRAGAGGGGRGGHLD